VLAVDDRHVAFCEYNGSVARIIISYPSKLYSDKVLSNRKFFGLTSDTAITLVFFVNSESLSFSSESLSVVNVSTLEKITVNKRLKFVHCSGHCLNALLGEVQFGLFLLLEKTR
jgi:hypothetical protein